MKEKNKKVLYWILILGVIGGIAKACGWGSSHKWTEEDDKYLKDAVYKDIYHDQYTHSWK